MKKTFAIAISLFVCLIHTEGLGLATYGGSFDVLKCESSELLETRNSQLETDSYTAAYGPHGEDWGSTGYNSTPFGWLGGYGVMTLETDTPLRLYLTRHRVYSATLNRFLSADPLGLAGGLNLYAYGNFNPLAFVDPLGLCASSSGWGYAWEMTKAIGSGFWEGWGDGSDIILNSLSLGLTDKYGYTQSYQYEGGVYEASRISSYVGSGALYAAGAVYALGADVILWGGGSAAAVGRGAAGAGAAASTATPTIGEKVYRVYGGDALATGRSWTPVNPNTVANFRNVAGLPSGGASGFVNTGRFVIEGTLVNPSAVQIIRPAGALDGNIGGLLEYVIPNWSLNGAIQIINVSGANPQF